MTITFEHRGPGRLVWMFVTAVIGITLPLTGADTLSLDGEWRFALDRPDAGISESWFGRDLAGTIQLPGVLQAQGYGDEISVTTPWVLSLYDRNWFLREDYRACTNSGSVKVPFVCQPPRHYLGAAWYQRDIEIPPDWVQRRVMLFLERPRWETRVWLDDRLISTNNSLCTPHEHDLGVVTPGKHRLTVRVDNRMLMNYRPDAHAVSDSLGSTWNGITGRIELRAFDPVCIERLDLRPDLERKGVEVTLFTRNDTGKAVAAPLVMLQVVPKNFGGNALKRVQQSATIEPGDGTLKLFFPMGDNFERWSEFNPRFYSLRASIGGGGFHSEIADVFGMREFKAVGQDFVINGRPIHLRGTHHGGDFPLTGYPPCEAAYWRRLFRTCKEWGLNHVRFHSFCPPEAAFTAADEVGVYIQPEPGMWNEISPGTPMERMLYDETERMLRACGNHPSFCLFSASNEAKGRWKEALPKWVEHFRAEDSRRLYTPDTGWSLIDEPGPVTGADYLAVHRIGLNMLRGERAWFGRDYARSLRGVNVPVVSHELGQWCAYPDFDVIRKFTGYARPGNYEIFRDSAAANGVLEYNQEFARASGRFQLACYKEEIEANLRTPGLGGFQLLDLHDYTGQGTALVGVLDPFWEEKGYVKSDEWRKFCGPTVPLARLAKRVFTTTEVLEAEVEVAHYGATPLTNVAVTWRVTDDKGRRMAAGEMARADFPIGRSGPLGKVSLPLQDLTAPAAYRLVVSMGQQENDWDFWLYPAQVSTDAGEGVLVTSSWDEAEAKLASGGKVLFLPRNANLDWTSPPLDDRPIFWNRLMNPQWGRMLGLWCDVKHPALAGFPTEANCDWQWTQLTKGTRAVNIGRLPRELKPLIAAVDDWNRNWKLAPVFECRVGQGRLLVCSFDISSDLDERPVARQLRRSLVDYVASDEFHPRVSVTPEQIRTLWFDTLVMRKLGAKSDTRGASAAFDGDPNTFWSVGGRGRGADGSSHPHELTLTFTNAVAMNGVVLMNRQNDRDHLGDIRSYRISTSDDGLSWREVASGELASAWSPQTVRFPATVMAKHLKLTALSGFGNDLSAALAEIAVLYAGSKLAEDAAGGVEYKRVRSTSTDVDEGVATPNPTPERKAQRQ